MRTREKAAAALRLEIAGLERALYDARTPDAERADLSLRLSVLRRDYARALGVGQWTATAALEAAAEMEGI